MYLFTCEEEALQSLKKAEALYREMKIALKAIGSSARKMH
jgi:hypothetical protein